MKRISTLLVLLFSLSSYASPYFNRTRVGDEIPAKCFDVQVKDFRSTQFVTYGIKGGIKKGFDSEYPIERGNAKILWNVFASGTYNQPSVIAKMKQRPELYRDFDVIRNSFQTLGYVFSKEGYIHEILVLLDLKKHFPEDDFFMSGGIEYHEANSDVTIGELDVLVQDRNTCEIQIVAEAKLGFAELPHARQQLARFQKFLAGKK